MNIFELTEDNFEFHFTLTYFNRASAELMLIDISKVAA